MAVPSSNITVTSIWDEANTPTSIGTDVSFGDLAAYDYFTGPFGSNTISYNGWGQSTAGGYNRIYGLAISLTGPYNFGDFANLVYFYDQSNYQCNLTVINNLAPAPPPPPPIINDIQDCQLYFKDFSGTYTYINGNSGAVTQGGAPYGPTDISQNTDPLIAVGHWYVDLTMDPSFTGGLMDVSINGTLVVNGVGIIGGLNTVDWNTYGTVNLANLGGYAGFNVVVTAY